MYFTVSIMGKATVVHVIVDARMAFHTGIGRYIRNLCQALLAQPSEHTLSLLLDPLLTQRAQQEIGPTHFIPFSAKIYSLTEQIQSLRLYRTYAKQAVLFHCPHYNIPWFLPRNSVVTVHDLTHFQFPEYFGKRRATLAFHLLKRAVQRAGHLITVSQATRYALEAFVPAAKGKTTVIYHGVADQFHPLPAASIEAFKRTHHLDRFFLYVGNAKPHKNIQRLLQAFSTVKTRLPQMALVLLGVAPSTLPTALERVYIYPNFSDEDLTHWYNAAEALVFPSLNEGFGLPVLEAMACGTPVISSKIAALHEVVDSSGLLIDPWNVDALARAMQQLASDADLRADLRVKGLNRAQHFSWVTAAQQTSQVYHDVLSQCRLV
jgi:glycosyltransferase involved in cell wall biosynthesis